MRKLLKFPTLVFSAALVGLGALGAFGAAAAPVAARGDKVVAFHGYRASVPDSWPVYNLERHPTVCVRFDRHAVYLGEPSELQRCPAHAVGRTEAILVAPLAAASARAGGSTGHALAPSAARGAHASSDTVVLRASGVVVTATWGAHPQLVERALRVRSLRAGRFGGSSIAPAISRAAGPGGSGGAGVGESGGASAGATYKGLGFDPCSTPSRAQMSAWKNSPYRAVGVYLGGTNMACAQTNLTPSWTSSEIAAGWHLIPTYVGLQAPSNSCGCAAIAAGRAGAEGTAAAEDAVAQAQAVGLGPGNPIYDDMEFYDRTHANTTAVLAFLSAWTARLHAAGYKSGVYGNDDSVVADMLGAEGTGFQEPDDIWFANWNGVHSTFSSYVPAGTWANHQRIHQYSGGVNETYGGVTLNVDGDYLDAATAGAGASGAVLPPDGTFVQPQGSTSIYEIAGGAPLYVSPAYWTSLGAQTVTTISQRGWASLNPVPADGTFLLTTTGALYRVAGGAPLYVSDATLFPSAAPVRIDEWDLDNLTNPAAHLNPLPANGTFLSTTAGNVYRVAGGAPFAINSWSVFGGPRPSVKVDQWDLVNLADPASHLAVQPAAGTIVEGLPSQTYWVFNGSQRTLTSPHAAAVQVPDSGLRPYPATPCVVPGLRGDTIFQVRSALLKAGCMLGKVRRLRSPRPGRFLHVASQAPSVGGSYTAGWRVAITLR